MDELTVPRPFVSIIVPAFNEEGVISLCVEELFNAMQKTQYCAEIIVVNDGSTDQTLREARFLRGKYPFLRVLSFARNYGKATALREGIRVAQGDTIAFFDADLQYDPADLVGLLAMLDPKVDIVTGLRDFRHYELTRTALSKIYNKLLMLIFRINVCDSNCGMKVLKRVAANPDFLFRYGTPLMVPLLKLKGFRIVEKEVSLRERGSGESKFFRKGSFLGGWKNIRGIYYNVGMLLGLLANLPSELLHSRNSAASAFHLEV
jgi:glycosyltransferase involved in cell wall biosynthesis